MICIGLRENEYRMCLLFLTTTALHHYTAHELDLIKAISYQLSPAIANILANEDIDRREKEKELLLALNIDIAAARSQDELLQVITQRLKSFIEFSYMMIIKIDSYPIEDPVFSKVLPHSQPKVFDLQQMDRDMALPAYFQADFASGARQVVIVRLSKGIQVYGCWFLYFPADTKISAGNLELLESIANQISIAVTNIIANMEIAQREQEKARLLSFSNAIASVRDKNILAKILKQQLKDLFDITDYVIHALSDNKQTYTPILFDLDANFAQHPDFRRLINAQNNVNDGIFDRILASEDPVFFDIDQCISRPGHPDYLKSAKAIKLKQMIGVSIRLGQENIAFITFIHDDYTRITEEYHLFKCILSQIALSVSNIVANEKVNRQLEEINKNKHHLEEEKIYLKEEIETTLNYGEIVGESPVMQKTFRLVAQVAPSDSTVLILGETGTGKELIARAIHNNSPRKNKLMVKVNCAALPANLIESELFGHERGSFTGATDRRLGKFELANNGTLFLDEIGEMPLELQVKLLRALQEREIERVGGNATIKVNVRVIAATNRDLETEMQEGRFRGDLYYRLNIFPIELPPLRHRKEDIPLLASYFINRFAKKAGKEILTLSTGALQEMIQYRWPGNIRELEHLIERSVLLASGDTIKQVHLPAVKQHNVKAEEAEFVIKTIDEHEREFILKTLKYCNGRIAGKGGAAILLGVPTSTLNSKIKRLGIRKEHIPR
jgi:transcriptional regulator with GAF, ATPase, and Fis domain